MRMTIATRLFLALTLVSLGVLLLNAAVTRWYFERDFLDYIDQQELETIDAVTTALARIYQADGDWNAIADDPRRWSDVLRGGNIGPPPGPRPGSRPGPGARPDSGPGGPPHDPTRLGRRMSLVDADGQVVVGQTGDDDRIFPIVLDDATVGTITIAPRRQLSKAADQKFVRDQERVIWWTAAAALLIAALFSALLSRQLTQPIRALAAGSRAIAAGKLDTRIEAGRKDELGELASDFNRLAETLEKNQASRQRWVADIAHELRTPLAILRGELDAVDDGIRPFDAATQKSLQSEVARLSQLVDDLHDLSMYDAGTVNIKTELIDVVELLSAMLDNATHRLTDAEITLVREFPGEPIVTTGNPLKLEQLFTNLITNTIRYTDSPGSLQVSCSATTEDVIIEFADSAPAVPDELLPQLFERLYRVNSSRSREFGGSGLGLAICRAIAEEHGGGISAHRSPAGGVLIRVTLPATGNPGLDQ